MAHSDRFAITIHGQGGHGASPHQTVDATLLAAQLVVNLQAIVSRRINPIEPAVVTVGKLEAGTTFNVIAHRAALLGTARSFDDQVRERLASEIRQIAEHTCAQFGAACDVDFEYGYPALRNDAGVTAIMREAASAVLGDEQVFEHAPILGGEDFARYCERVPGAFLFLGAGNSSRGIDYPHHHPRFDIDERALHYGVQILIRTALGLLAKPG